MEGRLHLRSFSLSFQALLWLTFEAFSSSSADMAHTHSDEQMGLCVHLDSELRLMDEHRKALQRDREKHEEDLRVALQKVKAINMEIQRNGSRHPELHVPFIAVQGPADQLASARRLGEVEACVSGEWCASVELQKPAVEICILVRLLAPLLTEEPVTEATEPGATNQVLRLDGLCGASGAKDVPESSYAVVSSERAAEIRAIPHDRPPKPHALTLLRAWLGLELHVRLSKELSDTLERLIGRGVAKGQEVPLLEGLGATLRIYQAQGFAWMASNVRNGLGCLLADDMGLGKTLQSIALLLHLRAEQQLARPALIVAPLSVLSNWAAELAKWAPTLRCCIYHGPNRVLPKNCLRDESSSPNGAVVDVILTTYHLVRDDLPVLLEKAHFSAMVLDEAQAIKNRVSQITRAVLEIASHSVGSVRIALTGTPVENRLSELHSIFSFILPGYLGSARDFEKEFGKPLEKDASPETESLRSALRSRLLTAIRPFVLRRCKSDEAVASDLPPKIELLHTVMLTGGQRRLYEAVQKQELDRVLGAAEERLRLEQLGGDTAEEGAAAASGADLLSASVRAKEVLSTLHALQQICNHPQALGSKHWPAELIRQAPEFNKSAENSGKMARLLALLEEVLSPRDGREGEKVLIFSQYVHTVQLLQWSIEKAFPMIKALTIHGGLGISEREEQIQRFRVDPRCSVLIMTLGTGGVGLNLAAASHVVHYDRCWNPAREAQATDRAHRIGQLRTVVVHRLVTQGTLEERLAQELRRKAQLAHEVIPSDATPTDITTFSVQELMDLLKMGPGDSEAAPSNRADRELR
ncbi:ywqA [Symbiodinium natans]|uniref:YwqA protein n=1 Tax=Symbiodinium natans TaxID=878477 RepID=A0A812NRR8_9DINO|nr:ywqA [Symbiodinium natans]